MQKTRKVFVSLLLLILSVDICLAQHWSYGLQPGGKRNAENLVESFQEMANDMEKFGEMQQFECSGPHQPSKLSDLKEALANLMEGETGRKTT
ncbi:PREDICTED: progonadoliberin-1 [Crocodylus porosus]|nr:PREDICTED: progonadoliberin-1 [Crocodylus porosus]XP_019412111.1 PREDICTED: progonadoliberin-1 [Crocodylus porosus]XP_019412112.1 PREDICTED: progonadoliberin-1 [Crocodylus porosus]